jgi:hypothetical protein
MSDESKICIDKGALVLHEPSQRQGEVVYRGRIWVDVTFDNKVERIRLAELTLINSAYGRLCDAILNSAATRREKSVVTGK